MNQMNQPLLMNQMGAQMGQNGMMMGQDQEMNQMGMNQMNMNGMNMNQMGMIGPDVGIFQEVYFRKLKALILQEFFGKLEDVYDTFVVGGRMHYFCMDLPYRME